MVVAMYALEDALTRVKSSSTLRAKARRYAREYLSRTYRAFHVHYLKDTVAGTVAFLFFPPPNT